MKTFIAAIPLFNSVMQVEAYRLRDKSCERILGTAHDFQSFGDALLTRNLDIVEQIGVDVFTGGKPLFVDLNQYQLLMDVPTNKNIPPNQLVCVLPDHIVRNDAVWEKCMALKELGYRLACEVTKPDILKDRLAVLFDYMLISYQHIGSSAWLTKLSEFKHLVVSDIPDQEAFETISLVPKVLFTGSFYTRPITKGASQISPLKINALQLLNQVNEADTDLTMIARIIERDPAISISLLRFINSPAVQVTRKITSIRNGVAILGQKEIKRWIMVAVSIALAEDRPNELARISLIRGKFAENLATAFELGALAPSLFMMGLFSLLDVILQKPMHEALQEIAVSERIRMALVERTGEFFEVLNLIFAYEHANWDQVSVMMIRNNLQPEKVIGAFIDALVWYRDLLEGIELG